MRPFALDTLRQLAPLFPHPVAPVVVAGVFTRAACGCFGSDDRGGVFSGVIDKNDLGQLVDCFTGLSYRPNPDGTYSSAIKVHVSVNIFKG